MSKRILVVEDQEDNRQIIRDMLAGKKAGDRLGSGNSRMSRDSTWMLAAFLTAGNRQCVSSMDSNCNRL